MLWTVSSEMRAAKALEMAELKAIADLAEDQIREACAWYPEEDEDSDW